MKKIFLVLILFLCFLLINLNNVNAGSNGADCPALKYDSTYNVSYYNDIKGKSGDSLLEGLATISIANHKYYNTYGETRGGLALTDVNPNDDSKVLEFYCTDITYSNAWKSDNSSWNREHLWCKSLSGGLYKSIENSESGAGADIHHIRAVDATFNSTRSNNLYTDFELFNDSNGNCTLSYSECSSKGQKTGCYNGSGYFEPRDASKGDVARILMYLYMHYSNEVDANNVSGFDYEGSLVITNIVKTKIGTTSGTTQAEKTQAAWDLLCAWNELDPVDSIEANRHDICVQMTGVRNPFIDHPEFADMIWDTTYSGEGALLDKGNSSDEETPVEPDPIPTEPQAIETTITELATNVPTTAYNQIYIVTGSFNNASGYTSNTNTYGNGSLTDGDKSINIYGLSGSSNCLTYSNGTYTYKNSMNFTTLGINDGTKVKVAMIYNGATYKNYSAYLLEIIPEEVEEINPAYYLIDKYYNNGVYTKKSNIYLNGEAQSDIAQYFHGNVDKDRTTYYNGEFLLMGNYDGTFAQLDSNNNPVNGINSGYRTEGDTVKHFVYKYGTYYDTYTVNNQTLHTMYVTLNKMYTTTYFDSTWVDGVHNVSSIDDSYLKDFLAFAAPCLTEYVLESNYITANGMKLELIEGSSEFGSYLAFRIYVASDNSGLVFDGMLLSEARVYVGNEIFDETPTGPEIPVEPEVTTETYNYTFTSKVFTENDQTKELGNYNWTLSGNGGFWGYDGTKGQQFGSGSYPYTLLKLTSKEEFNNVSQIVINTSGSNGTGAKLNVKVGNTIVKTITLTNAATSYTVDLTDKLSGVVSLEYSQDSLKAIYIKSITIVSEKEIVEETNEVTLTITKTINGKITSDKTVYNVGDTVIITILPNTGYQLSNLYIDEYPVEVTGDTYSFVITADTKAMAIFEEVKSTKLATFEFGSNGSGHSDGSTATSYSETNGGYTLSMSSMTKVYTGASDNLGNSCLKLGTGSAIASLKFTVNSDVKKVIIYVAKYKNYSSVININGTNYTITTSSNDGSYTAIEIDTSTTKTITIKTTTDGYRAMLNTIEYYSA